MRQQISTSPEEPDDRRTNTPRSAVIDAIHHRPVSPVPWSVKFTVEALERYRAHRGAGFDPVADILSPAHSLTGDIPHENIDAFLRVAMCQVAIATTTPCI